MKLYFAPLEGITTYVYRNLHQKYFGGIDKYFAPFVAPGIESGLKKKEINDIHPQNNQGINLVPQVLTNNVDGYLKTEKLLREFGYTEVNLNIGCPVGTVVSKKKGAGLLQDTDLLERFLDGVYQGTKCKVSIKTRIGVFSKDELEEIICVYNKFPVHELIVHPRLRNDYYKNVPDLDAYEYCVNNCSFDLGYNGDINSVAQYNEIVNKFKNIKSVMLGRGLIGNPALAMEVKNVHSIDKNDVYNFMCELMSQYIEIMGEQNTLFKLKEIWIYLKQYIDDGDKYYKKIKKSKHIMEYKNIIEESFER